MIFTKQKYIIRRGLMRGLRYGAKIDGAKMLALRPLLAELWAKNDLWVIDLTAEVISWPETLKLGAYRWVSWRPTCSFFREALAELGAKQREGGGSNQPSSLGRGV